MAPSYLRDAALGLILALLFFGCNPFSPCSAPKDDRRFVSAKMAPDEKTGVFVFKQVVYCPGDMMFNQPVKYFFGKHVIGAYDIGIKKTRILIRKESRLDPTGWNVSIHDITGNRALINETGQGLTNLSNVYYWLDLHSGALTPLPIRKELAEKGLHPVYVYVTDPDGNLALITTAQEKWSFNPSNYPRQLWLRRTSGEYERLTEILPLSEDYYGFKDGDLYYYSHADRACMIYNIRTRNRRKGDRREVPYIKVREISFSVSSNGTEAPPLIGRKVNGTWKYEEASIDPEDLP